MITNPVLRLGLGADALRRIFSEPYMMNWIPLTSLSLQLDYRLYGLAPAGYLITNVALHILSVLVLYAAFLRMTGERGRSAFVAAVFALHPLHVESVAWVTERKDVLSGLFFMLGLYAHARFAERPGAGRLALTTLLLGLGLLSKPSLVVFPFVLLLLDAWPLGRIAGSGAALRASLRRVLLEKIPMLLLLVAAISVLTFVLQRDAGAMSALEALSFGARLQNALESYLVYAAKALWPSGLAVFYPYAIGPPWAGVAAALLLLAVCALVAGAARARPYLAVGWLWYLGTLIPVVGLVQVGGQARADRYMYLPLIGLSIMLAWGVPELLNRRRARRWAAPAAVAALAALWVCTYQQVGHWRNTAALFEHAIAVTPDNFLAHEQLADFHLRAGDTAAAERHYREALAIRPDWPLARFGLADVRARRGDLVGAIADYESELRRSPNHPKVASRYGFALLRAGRLPEAARQLELAVAEDPGSAGPGRRSRWPTARSVACEKRSTPTAKPSGSIPGRWSRPTISRGCWRPAPNRRAKSERRRSSSPSWRRARAAGPSRRCWIRWPPPTPPAVASRRRPPPRLAPPSWPTRAARPRPRVGCASGPSCIAPAASTSSPRRRPSLSELRSPPAGCARAGARQA